jgi:hypothetical protein
MTTRQTIWNFLSVSRELSVRVRGSMQWSSIAEDVTQEVFVSLIDHSSRYDAGTEGTREPIQADIVVGQDGMTRAIRFVR